MIEFLRLLKFASVGAFGALINTLILYIFTEYFRVYYIVSSILAIEIAIVVQFILNDRWTFRDKRSSDLRLFLFRLLKSNLWRVAGIFVNISILYVLTELFKIYYIFSNFVGIGCAFIFNYIMESKLTWR
ncbi:GtrA family protein [Archaeoglobus fulgidus]|uniref:GtrA/DPMS transmembrane domain-containing protein n=1 Tax=Archaeoglobus fulgidus (strain ATCC 49558 / DSM 4304 / JCM 9628 / NBRC 100126 / VC-16) TaxID=224325 RepID=O29640_ARCFU|nr:predicted coding region AF_0615 [Archaeoglobus fulgidus DSM 4304]